MSTLMLEVGSAAKSFGQRRVLDAASLWAYEGEVTALLGRNGCGKTTLLRIATGLLSADSGNIRFRGEHVERPRLHLLARRGLAFLPARRYLPFDHTLRAIFALCAADWRARPFVEELSLTPLLDRAPASLSGGELRRAEVASALLLGPACLLADEPFRGIAPADCELLVGMLRRHAAMGGAVVVTGHEAVWMLAVADRVVWCHDGTTEGIGSPGDARGHFRFRQAYLGPDN